VDINLGTFPLSTDLSRDKTMYLCLESSFYKEVSLISVKLNKMTCILKEKSVEFVFSASKMSI